MLWSLLDFLDGFISHKKDCFQHSGQEFVKTVISDTFMAKDSIYLYIWVSYEHYFENVSIKCASVYKMGYMDCVCVWCVCVCVRARVCVSH